MYKILTFFLFVLSLALLFKTCSNKKVCKDYIFIEGKKDTVIVKITDTINQIKPVFVKSKEVLIKDSFIINNDTVYINELVTLNQFKTEINDSLIKATIISNVKGLLINTDFKYTFSNKTISSTDTVIKTIPNKNKFYVGAVTNGNTLLPSVLYNYKSNYIFKASYDINNNNPYIGVYFKF